MDALPTDIGDALLKKGLVNLAQLRVATEARRKAGGGDVGDFVVQLRYATDEQVARCRAQMLDLPFIDLNRVVMDTALLHHVSKMHLFNYKVLPIEMRADGKMLTAVASPSMAIPVLRRLEAAAGVEVAIGISPKSAIVDRLIRLFGPDLAE